MGLHFIEKERHVTLFRIDGERKIPLVWHVPPQVKLEQSKFFSSWHPLAKHLSMAFWNLFNFAKELQEDSRAGKHVEFLLETLYVDVLSNVIQMYELHSLTIQFQLAWGTILLGQFSGINGFNSFAATWTFPKNHWYNGQMMEWLEWIDML